MSELIERIAREVALEIMEIHVPAEVAAFDWPDDASGDTIDRARRRAERIVAALREPTNHMAEMGSFKVNDTQTTLGAVHEAHDVWEAMIDAALSETTK